MFNKAFTLLVFTFLLILSPAIMAGDSIPTPPSSDRELSDRNIRVPEKSYFILYLNNKEYNYGDVYIQPAKETFFDRLWRLLLSIWKHGMKALQYIPLVIKVVFFALCLLLLFVIITKTKLYKVFYTDAEITEPEYFEVNPFDEQFDFNEAIGVQISQQNFRNVIRLLHLKILKELETQGIIRFSREKTNREYAREITDSNLKSTFFELAGIYNKVWFGNYNLSRDEFDRLASGFYQFSAKINAQKE
jgi:hypothetical protein